MVLDPKRSDVAIKQLQSSVASIKKNQTRIDGAEEDIDDIKEKLKDHKHETFEYDVTFNAKLFTGNVDLTISDAEYDELLNLLGGVVPRLIDWIYPVGHIISTTNANYDPNNLYIHQTWERYAKGQTLVGVDESDTDFATAGKTGGEKTHKLTVAEMPAHNHNIRYYKGPVSDYLGGSTADYGLAYDTNQTGVYDKVLTNTGGNAGHNNLQPYITVYMWRRTA